MTDAWRVVLVAGIASMAIKAAGPVAIGGRALPRRLMGLVAMIAPALLAALVVTQVFGGKQQLVLDARVPGVAVAAALLAFRAPVLVVIVAAAVVTALARGI
jgi:branched-subunit amino acid transport protein